MNMFSSKTKIVSAAAVLVLGSTFAVVASSTANADANSASKAPAEWSVAEADANYDLKLLDSGVSSRQKMPANLELEKLGGDGLRPDTVRLAAADENASTYVGLNHSNLLCVIVYIPGDEWTAGSTCTTPELFDKKGIGLRVMGPGTSHETYIIPDAAANKATAFTNDSKLESPNLNVIVVDPDLSSEARADVQKRSGNFPIALITTSESDDRSGAVSDEK